MYVCVNILISVNIQIIQIQFKLLQIEQTKATEGGRNFYDD